jgi:phage gp36-like protein
MFLTKDELKSAVYTYQIDEITEADDDIVCMAIRAAEKEVASYLRVNYDTGAIFGATGSGRDALILELCKSVAVWYVARLCNVDMLYEHIRERYDRAVEWLNRAASNDKDSSIAPDLPIPADPSGQAQTRFRFGSNPKFNHTYE